MWASQHGLAEWLLAQELANGRDKEALVDAAERACQKLGKRLARLVTKAGYQALLARALHLARARFPFLDGVAPGAALDPCLDGLRERARDVEPTQLEEGIGAVLAGLIGLLEKFIGNDLALRMVRDVWPEAQSLGQTADNQGERP